MKEDHPFIGTHCVLSSIKPNKLHEIRKQVCRLAKLPSNAHDPDFWKVIQYGKDGDGTKTYTAVRKLKVSDPKELINEHLLSKVHL